MDLSYDIAIIGGGPAGLAAGLYASRGRMNAILLEKLACGGQVLTADTIENFPGFPDGVKGPALAEWMVKQAGRFGLETRNAEAKGVILKKDEKAPFVVRLTEGDEVRALSLIIATGASWNKLGIPGEEHLAGRGVSYCATCDGPLFKNKEVVVIGGGDTAIDDALFLTKFASKVTVVHRRDRLRAAKILQERASANKKVELCLDSVAVEVLGKDRVEGVKVKNVKTGREIDVKASGVFVLIGISPNSGIVKGLVTMDEKGYVICDDEMKTSMDGVFACGDVRKKLLRQVVTAAGDGATAAYSAQTYVERIKGVEYK